MKRWIWSARSQTLLSGNDQDLIKSFVNTRTNRMVSDKFYKIGLALRNIMWESFEGILNRNRYSRIVFTIICLTISVFTQSAYAEEPTEQMKQSIDSVLAVLKNKSLEGPEKTAQRRTAIRKIVYSRFDFREMSKRALALHWKKRTPAERKEFVSLFADLLEATYIEKIERYSDEKILYVDESVDGGYAEVETKVLTKDGREIPIDYLLIKEGVKWMVYDVNIEGMSLIENYRTQFEEIIGSGSYGELVKKLKEKVRSTKDRAGIEGRIVFMVGYS